MTAFRSTSLGRTSGAHLALQVSVAGTILSRNAARLNTNPQLERWIQYSARTLLAWINRAKAQKFVNRQTALRFLAERRSGNTNLKGQLRWRRPRKVDRGAVFEAIEEDPTLTMEEFAYDRRHQG
ncbi:hypothetical protein KIN20_013744 [Parelaphostrongylus tenuis]|uniref:Uncharacterized protein n=1 Tax=Parelaphostrongylus tenuis TaxID=148309 RepID=A0AAD5MCJ5_PARTN|nr:hypothetical protein KIN20_013744 [Parelaphostrongylus tenuis]